MFCAVCPHVNPAQKRLKIRTDFLDCLHHIGNAKEKRCREGSDCHSDGQMSGRVCFPACRKPEGPAHEKCEHEENPIATVRHRLEHKSQTVYSDRNQERCQRFLREGKQEYSQKSRSDYLNQPADSRQHVACKRLHRHHCRFCPAGSPGQKQNRSGDKCQYCRHIRKHGILSDLKFCLNHSLPTSITEYFNTFNE